MRHCQCILLTDGLIDETSITQLMLFDSYGNLKETIFLDVECNTSYWGFFSFKLIFIVPWYTTYRAIFIYDHIEYNLDAVVYCYKVFRYLRSLSRWFLYMHMFLEITNRNQATKLPLAVSWVSLCGQTVIFSLR